MSQSYHETNGTTHHANGTTAEGGSATQETGGQWQDPSTLMWSLLDDEDRLTIILNNPVTEEWYQRTPCDYLVTLAAFRPIATQWGRISERFKALGGKPTNLEKAVDQLLGDAQMTRADTDAVPLVMALVSSPTLLKLSLPPRQAYLSWLRERSLTMVYGPAGVGKTMFLMGIGLSLATAQPFLTWRAPEAAVRVVYVDGEMSLQELQDRLRQLAGDTPPPGLSFLPSELVYERTGRDLTLTEAADRQAIDAILEAQGVQVLILDNVSCLFPGIDESNKKDWEPVNAWLIRLRHRGISVLIGHHAGKNGQQRGTSGREDALNTIIALTKPPGHKPEDGCHFHLRFEKSRGIKGAAVAALDVRLEETANGLVWTAAPLEVTRTEQVKAMLAEGIPAKVIADELTIHLSYVYRLKKQLGL